MNSHEGKSCSRKLEADERYESQVIESVTKQVANEKGPTCELLKVVLEELREGQGLRQEKQRARQSHLEGALLRLGSQRGALRVSLGHRRKVRRRHELYQLKDVAIEPRDEKKLEEAEKEVADAEEAIKGGWTRGHGSPRLYQPLSLTSFHQVHRRAGLEVGREGVRGSPRSPPGDRLRHAASGGAATLRGRSAPQLPDHGRFPRVGRK